MGKKTVLDKLKTLFRKNKVLNMEQLLKALGVTSGRTVFRYLQELHALTSYTDAGRYYTISEVAQFDGFGFWHHGDIGFSSRGTLINTLQWVISTSESGKTNSELEKIFRIRVQNTLQRLLKPGRIARVKSQKQHLYTSSDPAIGQQQFEKRQEIRDRKKLPAWIVAEVLIETIRSLSNSPKIEDVMKGLKKRGSLITYEQVKQVFEEEDLEKKTSD